jgi:hypothetical protein
MLEMSAWPRGAAAAVALAALLFGPGADAVAAGPVYQWLDENGSPVFSERPPPPGRVGEILDLKSGKPAADAAARLARSRSALAPPAKKEPSTRPPLTPEQRAQRADACTQARQALSTLQNTNRPRYQADDGQLIVMDDALKAARIADAEEKIGDYCDE